MAVGKIEHMFDTLPPDLDAMPPGPGLAAALASVDVGRLSGHDRVVVLRAEARMEAHHAARKAEAMAAIYDALEAEFAALPVPGDDPGEAAQAEIKVALCLTTAAAGIQLGHALSLRDRVPAVLAALAAGRIDSGRARVLVDETACLSDPAAREVVAAVIDGATGQTTTQIKRRVRRLAIAVDPAAAERRYKSAVDERRVEVDPNPDGTADLAGRNLPPHRVTAIKRYLTHLARKLRRRGDPRSMDQLRADLFLDLLSGNHAAAGGSRAKGFVELRVDIATLVGLSEQPGDLGGYGPVVADLARQLALASPEVEWRYAITDPDTGLIRQVGTTRRRPTAAQRRYVTSRDPTCPFPGCVAPSGDSDLDHIHQWADGGRTTVENLAPPCPAHHQLRHRIGWTYQPFTDTDYLWTTLLGHRYTTSGAPAPDR